MATVHATDGMCTHGNTHLADGMVPRHGCRVSQAQRPLRRHDRRTPSPARVHRLAHVSRARRVTAALAQRRVIEGARRSRTRLLHVTRSSAIRTSRRSSRNWCSRQSRTATGRRSALDSTSNCRFQPTATSRSATSTSSAIRVSVAGQSSLRPGRQQRAGAPAELLARNQPGLECARAALQRADRHAAARAGLRRRRRLVVCLPLEARRHGHGQWSVRRFPDT